MALVKKSCMPEFPEEKFAEFSTPYFLNYVEKLRKNVTAASDPLRSENWTIKIVVTVKSCECTFWKSMHAFALETHICIERKDAATPILSFMCCSKMDKSIYTRIFLPKVIGVRAIS